MYCKNCGKEIDDNAYFCVHCGVRTDDVRYKDQTSSKRFCTHCGKEIDPNAFICVHCGTRTQREVESRKSVDNYTVFAIISMVLSFIFTPLLGAVFAIFGMLGAINKKDAKGIRINIVAICVCALFCVLNIIFGLI